FGVSLFGPADWAMAAAFFEKRTPHVVARVDFTSAALRTAARVLGRLDTLSRVEFVAAEPGAGFSVGDARGGAAFARVVRALPLGLLWSLPLRIDFVADAVLGAAKLCARVLASREVEERKTAEPAPRF